MCAYLCNRNEHASNVIRRLTAIHDDTQRRQASMNHPVSWTGWRSTTMLMILYDLRRSRSQRQRARKKAATTRLIGKPPRPLASATSMPLVTMTRNHAWRPRSCQASLPCVALLSRCTFSSTSLYVQVLAVLDPVLARALRPCVYNVASSSSPKSSKSLPYVPV